jgi:hypothetical protein
VLLDTHVLVWLHMDAEDRFSRAASAMLETEPLRVSPASLLELTYLHEIGRTAGGADEVVAHLAAAIGLQVGRAPVIDAVLGRCLDDLDMRSDRFA